MPELVNSRVGSLPGTSGADGTMVWPRAEKNSRKSRRMSEVVRVLGAAELQAVEGIAASVLAGHTGGEEEQRLEAGMGDEMQDGDAGIAGADGDEHEAEVRRGGSRRERFGMILKQRQEAAGEHRTEGRRVGTESIRQDR